MIYLIREADAGDRDAWPGPDMLRPITREGWRQARALVALMDGVRVERVLSSPYLRCRQTVGPLAEQRELDLETDRLLSDSFAVERTLDVLARLGAAPAVVCTHAQVMDELLALLVADDFPSGRTRQELAWLRVIRSEAIGIAS